MTIAYEIYGLAHTGAHLSASVVAAVKRGGEDHRVCMTN